MCSTKFYPVFGEVTYVPSIPVREANASSKYTILRAFPNFEREGKLTPNGARSLSRKVPSPSFSVLLRKQLPMPLFDVPIDVPDTSIA
jgi:hypothetical protein